MDKDQTLENLNPKGHFSPKLWALEYKWEGKQWAGLLQSREREKDLTWDPDGGPEGTQGGRAGSSWTCAPRQESWAAPLAIGTAEVASFPPRAAACTSFSSLTFALVFSEHWGGERTCLQVKAAQLKFPPKLSGCSLGLRVTAAIISCTSTPKQATWTPAGKDNKKPTSISGNNSSSKKGIIFLKFWVSKAF